MEGLSVKAMVAMIMASILIRCVSATATNHIVGGTSGWDLSSNLQAWVSQNTFHVGDSLVFSYSPVLNVMEVNQLDYELCVSSHPIQTHNDNDGETLIPLTCPGSRFFISSQQENCRLGLKVHIQVFPPPKNLCFKAFCCYFVKSFWVWCMTFTTEILLVLIISTNGQLSFGFLDHFIWHVPLFIIAMGGYFIVYYAKDC